MDFQQSRPSIGGASTSFLSRPPQVDNRAPRLSDYTELL